MSADYPKANRTTAQHNNKVKTDDMQTSIFVKILFRLSRPDGRYCPTVGQNSSQSE